MIAGLIVFLLLVLLACWAVARTAAVAQAAGLRPAAKPSIGRAALRAYRGAGDVRAIGRGTYPRRVVRRAAFRTVRRW